MMMHAGLRAAFRTIALVFLVPLGCAGWPAFAQSDANLVRNDGFEVNGNPARDWSQDTAKTGDKGSIGRDTGQVRSGKASLRLQPNGKNAPPSQLAVSQQVPLAPYGGKSVTVSASMRAEGGARALAGLIVIGRNGFKLLQVNAGLANSDWTTVSRTFELPDDASASYHLALWVDGNSGAAWFDDVYVGLPKSASIAKASIAGTGDPWNPPLGEPVQNLTLSEGWTDARLVAEPVNTAGTGGWTDSVAVSRDGKRLYFAYTKWDYHTFERTQRFVATGPDRSAAFMREEMQIYQADLGPSGWVVTHHPVNRTPAEITGAMGHNSAEDTLVFNTYHLKPSYHTIMRMATRNNGSWIQAGPLPAQVNSPAGCLDDNGFLVGSLAGGATLFFESTRTQVDGLRCSKSQDRHLYFATYRSGAWSSAQAVPGVNSMTTGDNDMQPFVLEDLSRIFWLGNRPSQGKYGLFTADRSGQGYTNPRMVIGISTFTAPWAKKVVRIGEPTVAVLPQGSVMYFMCGIALGDNARREPDNIQYRVCFARKPN